MWFLEFLQQCQYEDVYLKGYADGREARAGIAGWIGFYNGRRPHQALAGRTPMAVWREDVIGILADNAVDMTLRLDDTEPASLPIKNDGPVVPPVGSPSQESGTTSLSIGVDNGSRPDDVGEYLAGTDEPPTRMSTAWSGTALSRMCIKGTSIFEVSNV